jgi:hypothetical protein
MRDDPPDDDEFFDGLIDTVEKGEANLKAKIALSEAYIDMLAASQATILSSPWKLFDYIGKRIKLMDARRKTRDALEEYLACDFLPGEQDAKLTAEVSRSLGR